MKIISLLILVFPITCFSLDLCDYLKIDTCNNSKRPLARSNSASFPSTTTAAFNNPTALTMERGLGLESIFYKNHGNIGIVSGTGRIGAAISTTPPTEIFFGHYALETQNQYRKRILERNKYQDDNFNLAFAFNLFGKKKRKGLQVDLGGIFKHHKEKNENFLGAGINLSYNKVFNIGYSKYNDVLYEDIRGKTIDLYDTSGGSIPVIYPEDDEWLTDVGTTVENTIIGLKFANFALDHLTIKTIFEDEYYEPTIITILAGSIFYKEWIFTYGKRTEESFREVYQDEEFIEQRRKYNRFLGAQYALGEYILIGLYHNYYLFNEVTMGISIFF